MARTKRIEGAPNKSAFVMQHPHKTAAEVVALAREQGITMTPGLVHTVRSTARRGVKALPTTRNSDKLVQLKQLVIQVGYDAARSVIDAVQRQIDSVRKVGKR